MAFAGCAGASGHWQLGGAAVSVRRDKNQLCKIHTPNCHGALGSVQGSTCFRVSFSRSSSWFFSHISLIFSSSSSCLQVRRKFISLERNKRKSPRAIPACTATTPCRLLPREHSPAPIPGIPEDPSHTQPLHLEPESLLQLFLLLVQGIFQSLLCCFLLLELAEQVQNLKASWNKQE